MSDHYQYKNSIEAPRWARCDIAIKSLCFELDLKYEIERDTTLLREIIRFIVKGPKDKILLFKETLENTLEDYNN